MEPNPIVEKRYNRRWKTKKPNEKRKGRKRINLAEHDPSERVLFARAKHSRSKQRAPVDPFCSYPLHSPFFPPFIPILSRFPPPSLLLCPRKRNLVLDRDSCSSDAILVYRVWLGRETRLACPDVRQLKQADVHDIAQSVIRIGWLIAPDSLDGEI